MRKVITLALSLLILKWNFSVAQKVSNYGDSLAGFNEQAAKEAALKNRCFGNEFTVYMEMAKRKYVNKKYNLPTHVNSFFLPNQGHKVTAVAPACNNEDFEGSPAGQVTTVNQVAGWTVGYGYVFNQDEICTLTPNTCCPNPPQEIQVFSNPTGYIDPVIGNTYPIYSVFGSGAPNAGIGANPTLGLPNMYGNNFIRINSSTGNPWHNSVAKLSKTFNVTAANALFQFAYIGVFYPDHTCCDAPSMQIQLTNATTNSVLACPNFSLSVPTAQCSNTNTMQYFVTGTGANYTNQWNVSVFNKWKLYSIDLTPYISQNITIDVMVADCPYGGHYGYVYFDAQCSPMDIIGNNSSFPAGTPSITLPTCGASGATITLPNGLGPYSWNGPGITGNWTVPSHTNQTIVTNVSGTLNAIMNPAGACAPIIKNITVTITPAPNLFIQPLQPTCSSTTAAIFGTLTVGATPFTAVTTGPTGTVVTNVTGATMSTTNNLVPGQHTVTITDGIGCNLSQVVTINPPPAQASFTVGSPGNDYTLTCINTPITMTTQSFVGPLNYTWTSPSGTATGISVNVTQPGNWQVIGQHPVSGCSVAVNFTIGQDVSSPSVAVSPTVQVITCNVAASCFTAFCTPGPNVTSNWFQVVGSNTIYVGVPQGTINIFCPSSPGVYWFEGINNITGCRSTFSVNVSASVGVPQFTLTSPTNFTIGCGTTSLTSMQVTSVLTSPVPNTPVSYTFMTPPVTGTPAAGTWTNNPNLNNISVPGTYVVYVQDLTNFCIVSQSISIIQNTLQPNVSFIQPLSILNCNDPCMVLTGVSSNNNVSITWTVPAVPSNSVNPTPNHTVCIDPSKTNATNSIVLVGTYTVGAVDNNNMCRSSKTVSIIQDVRLPRFNISALTNSVINCKNPDVVIVPLSTATWMPSQLVPTYVWYPPVGDGVAGSQFNTTACGSHTAIATSAVNGCTVAANNVYNVACDFNAPALDPSRVFTLDCGVNPTVAIFPVITGTTVGFTYNWYLFPPDVFVSNPNQATITVNKVGEYGIVVTNTINGCKTDVAYHVEEGELSVDFTPSASFGYAPLGVTFANNSSSSFSTGVMIANWSFGNGTILTNTYTNGSSSVTPSANYTSPGTYSVQLFVTKGSCTGTMVKMIVVELPSKIEVPNVFTPNGDKVNDNFRLIASSLSTVEAIIFDRWGNKVYEVVSETGNFAWDGKNLQGKDCPDGTYFYMIKATGKDGQEYDLKGNVSLFR